MSRSKHVKRSTGHTHTHTHWQRTTPPTPTHTRTRNIGWTQDSTVTRAHPNPATISGAPLSKFARIPSLRLPPTGCSRARPTSLPSAVFVFLSQRRLLWWGGGVRCFVGVNLSSSSTLSLSQALSLSLSFAQAAGRWVLSGTPDVSAFSAVSTTAHLLGLTLTLR